MNLKTINPKHNLYILKVYNKDTTLIKLGYSSKMKDRIEGYFHHNPLCELVGTFYREDAEDFELIFHKNIQAKTRREWYEEDKLELMLKYINNELEFPVKKVNDCEKIDYVKMVRVYKKTKNIEEYQHKVEYYDLIMNSVKYYNKTWFDYTYAKNMVNSYKNEYAQIIHTIRKKLNVNQRYTLKEVKLLLQSIYDQFKLNRKAKSTDIKEFMYVKESKIKGNYYITILDKNKTLNHNN